MPIQGKFHIMNGLKYSVIEYAQGNAKHKSIKMKRGIKCGICKKRNGYK